MGNRELVVVGDRVLIKHTKRESISEMGLILPQNVVEKEQVQAGHVVAIGPGIPIPAPGLDDDEEPWKPKEGGHQQYIALQAEPGDYALFLKKHSINVKIDHEDFMIVPHGAILILLRDHVDEF